MKKSPYIFTAILALLFLSASCTRKKLYKEQIDKYKSGYRNPSLIGDWLLVRAEREGGIVFTGADSLKGRGTQKFSFQLDGLYKEYTRTGEEIKLDFEKYWFNPDDQHYQVFYKPNSNLYGSREAIESYLLSPLNDMFVLVNGETRQYYVHY